MSGAPALITPAEVRARLVCVRCDFQFALDEPAQVDTQGRLVHQRCRPGWGCLDDLTTQAELDELDRIQERGR